MDITKLLMVGGVAYVAYQWFATPSVAVNSNVAPNAPISPVATNGGNVSTPTMANVANVTGLKQVMIAAQARLGLTAQQYNFHEWNYIFNTATGRFGPAPQDVAMGDGNNKIGLDQWITAVGSVGVSGLGSILNNVAYTVPTAAMRRENRTSAEQASIRSVRK